MKITFLTFTKSLVAYSLITLLVLVIPPMYIQSLLYAIVFGFVAWFFYHLLFRLVQSQQIIDEHKWLLLIVSIPICVSIAYTFIEVFEMESNVWSSEFIFFPIIAVLSGWIGLYKTREQISEIFESTTHQP